MTPEDIGLAGVRLGGAGAPRHAADRVGAVGTQRAAGEFLLENDDFLLKNDDVILTQ